MKTFVSFEFVGPTDQHTGLTPRTLLDRTYDSLAEALIPSVGDQVLIQWGEDSAQSDYFVVDGKDTAFWADKDCITLYVKRTDS